MAQGNFIKKYGYNKNYVEENERREVEVLTNERPGCRENNGVVWSKLDGGVVMIGIYMLLM